MTYPSSPPPVTPENYDPHYYLNAMEGAEQFSSSEGKNLTPRLSYPLDLAEIKPGQSILDLGCGRGEITWNVANLGASSTGIDYSSASMQIAKLLRERASEASLDMTLVQGGAYHLPFRDLSFDTVFMLDIVEHLYPLELFDTFAEVYRVLKRGGRLVIHTMPNQDYYRYGYPVFRLAKRLQGIRLPKDPRQRWYRGEVHVNVQNPRGLNRTLRSVGFEVVQVWIEPLSGSPLYKAVLSLPWWKWVLVNDILAVAKKR
jgi:ubiquinone/menaquinone biosynthesis C-methylase UbiE